MPIQRQSEQFAAFETGPRWERDRPTHELPRGLAGLVNNMGPRISAGLLNTRTAVNTDGMDPNEHAYGGGAGDPLFGEFGHDGYDYEGVSPGEFRHRMRGYDPDEASARRREEIEDEDDESGYNWGPVPPGHLGSRHPFDRAAARRLTAFDWFRHIDAPDLAYHKAKLENGHELHAWEHHGPEGGDGWHWAISDPGGAPDGELSEWSHPEEYGHLAVAGQGAGWIKDGGTVVHEDYIHDLKEAKRQAQEHYKEMFPMGGTGTGGHDSGVDYSDLNKFLRDSALRLAKDGDCTCWEGYERVPGTEPCASKSCRKKAGLILDRPDDYDSDDFFGLDSRHGTCSFCKRPRSSDSGPFCDHGDRRTAQMSYEDTMKYIDDTLAKGEPEEDTSSLIEGIGTRWCPACESEAVAPTNSPTWPGEHECNDCGASWMADSPFYLPGNTSGGHRTAAGEMAVAPQQPLLGGGYQIAHRVGLPWRGNLIPGTVINLDGPNVAVRWDDGQYSTEEPHNIQLL